MNTTLQDEIRKWDAEVEAETIRLIRKSFSPYDAALRAGQIVGARRQSEDKQGNS